MKNLNIKTVVKAVAIAGSLALGVYNLYKNKRYLREYNEIARDLCYYNKACRKQTDEALQVCDNFIRIIENNNSSEQ